MGAEWVMQLTPMVFTRIKNGISEKTKEKYRITNMNFSTVGSNKNTPTFPFIYINSLDPVERGRDLEGNSINGGLFAFQIEVTDNKSQDTASKIMEEIICTMKRMSFETVAMPRFESTKDSYRCIARFRRAIDENDIL